MEKKLVGLYVPAVQEKFDLLVPVDLEIRTVTALLTNGVKELCPGRYTPSGQETLSMRYPEMLLQPGKTLADYGAENGTQLLMM